MAASLKVEEASTPAKPDDYIFVNNLRLVRPYYFDFKCNIKARWEKMTLVDLFSQEFPMLTRHYYETAFHAGRLRVENLKGQTIDNLELSTPLITGMCVRHLIHRHEPPVLAGDVQVVEVTDDFVAVVKPPCMPVHTCGQYRKNTVLGILESQRPDLGHLLPTYRLDKPVSGLLVLAKSSAAASRMRVNLEKRECRKKYLARVQGLFPSPPSAASPDDDEVLTLPIGCSWVEMEEEGGEGEGRGGLCIRVDVPLSWNPKTNHVTAIPPTDPSDKSTEGAHPAPSPNKGKDEDAKVAVTLFRCVSRSESEGWSLVECLPLTGRTHQIRVHLEYLGHSIANDTQYGGLSGPPLVYRLNRERTGPSEPSGADDEIPGSSKRIKVKASGSDSSQQDCMDGDRSKEAGAQDQALPVVQSLVTLEGLDETLPEGVRELYESSLYRVSPEDEEKICPHCPCLVPRGYPIDLEPLFLYAYSYSGPGWGFRVPPPHWAHAHGKEL